MAWGLEGGSEQQPTPAWEDRVLEPALSQELNRRTNGQAVDAMLSWYQVFVPGQTGLREWTLLSSPVARQPPGDLQESTKDQGAWAHTQGLSPWEGVPGAAPPLRAWELLLAGALLLPRPQKGAALGGLTSRVPHLPPLVPSPGPPAPPVAMSRPFPSGLPIGPARAGPLPPVSVGAVKPRGAVRDLHTNLYLLENCPQTVLKMDQGPSSLHLTFALPDLSPVLQEALPPPPLEGLGYFSPKVKHRQGLGPPISVFGWGWPSRRRGLQPPSSAHGPAGMVSRTQAPPHPSEPTWDQGPTWTHPSPQLISSFEWNVTRSLFNKGRLCW